MNVLDRFLSEISPTATEELLEACWSWVSWSVAKIAGCSPDARHEDPSPGKEPTGVAAEIMDDLQRRLAEAVQSGLRRHGGKSRVKIILTNLTSGFLRGDEDMVGRYNGFQSFIVALSCYHLLRRSEEPLLRTQIAECLLLSLSIPVESISLAITVDRETDPADDEIVDRLAGSLVHQWSEATPSDFGTIVGAAKKRGEWGTLDILRDRGKLLQAAAVKTSQQDSFEDQRVYVLHELLDALYPIACQITEGVPNDRGRRLFLWLILGGVSHTRANEERAAKSHLVQPALIAALIDRFNANFIRNYQNRVNQGFAAGNGAYWAEARSRLLEVLQQDGLSTEQLRQLRDFLGESPEEGMARLADAAGAPKVKAVRKKSAAKSPTTAATEPNEGAPSPAPIGWHLFLEVGRQTFTRIKAGHLKEMERFADELSRSADPVADVRNWLCPKGTGLTPERAVVAGATDYLCQQTRSMSGWLAYLTEFAEEREDAAHSIASRP
jgi:hypothetical protein